MKSNRKIREEKEAVSAVIGVILMVAITVAIAATIYVYISGTLGETKEYIPNIIILKSSDTLTVSSSDNNLNWNDFIFTFNTTTASLNGNSLTSGIPAASATITAGDYVTITCTGTVTLIHDDTNSLMGIWTFA